VKFLRLTIESFGPLKYGPVTLPLDGQGLVLIEGENWDTASADSNGAGKSMLFEAIPWALWGKMPRYGDKVLGDQACHPKDGACVDVEFEIDGGRFCVQRRKEPGHSAEVDFYVWHREGSGQAGWVSVEGTALHTPDADPSSLLGFTYDTFRSALFLQAAGFKVTTGGFAAQMRLLEEVLRFDVLSEAGETAKQRGAESLVALTATEGRLNSLQREIQAHDQEIATLDALDESAEEERLQQEIAHLESGRRSGVEWGLGEARKDYEKTVLTYSQARAELQSATADIEKYRGLNGKSQCPTCLQSLEEQYVRPMLAGAEEDLLYAQKEVTKAKSKMDSAKEIVSKWEVDQAEQHSVLMQLSADRVALNSLLARKVTLQAQYERVRRLRAVKASEAETIKQVVVKQKWDLDTASFWSKAFTSGDGLKAEILGSAAPVLNAAAHRYSELLTDDNIRVEFNALRGKKTEDLIRLSGSGSPRYEGLSSGEKRRVDLIVALSLRSLARWRLSRPVNISLADEIFDALDETGLQRVSAVIQQDTDELSSMFLVTHNPQMKSMFPGAKTWRVVRKGGTSKVYVD